MRHHIYALTQTHTSTPRQVALMETQTRIITRGATRGPAVVLRLALGVGMALLLALLSACVLPRTQDTARDATPAEQAQIQTLSPSELEDAAGLPPWLFDDFFARL